MWLNRLMNVRYPVDVDRFHFRLQLLLPSHDDIDLSNQIGSNAIHTRQHIIIGWKLIRVDTAVFASYGLYDCCRCCDSYRWTLNRELRVRWYRHSTYIPGLAAAHPTTATNGSGPPIPPRPCCFHNVIWNFVYKNLQPLLRTTTMTTKTTLKMARKMVPPVVQTMSYWVDDVGWFDRQ